MNRLNLDAFKTKANKTQEIENLTGGILGACHCLACGGYEGGWGEHTFSWGHLVNTVGWYRDMVE